MRTIKRVRITTPIEQYVGIMAETQEEAEGIVKEILSHGRSDETDLTRRDIVEELRKKGSINRYNIKVNNTEPGILRYNNDGEYTIANADWKATDEKRDYGDGGRYEEIHAIRKAEEKRYDIQIFIDEENVCGKSVTLPNGVEVYGSGDTTTYIELRDVDEDFFKMLRLGIKRMGQVVSTVFKPEKLKDGPVEGRVQVAWKIIKKQDDTPTENEGVRLFGPVNPFDSGAPGTGVPIFRFTGVLN